MRSRNGARWAWCALALVSLIAPASAQPDKHERKKTVGDCATFDQKENPDATVDFTVTNACTIKVECSVTWSVTCAPDSPKRRSSKHEGASFNLETSQAKTSTASAARCGDDGWSIDDVTWSCAPSKD